MTNKPIGRFLTLSDFCTCTQTYARFKAAIDPWPVNPQSLLALECLATHILDPVISHFGQQNFHLTYGFCSNSLKRHLAKKDPRTDKPYGRVAPSLDQHMAHETNSKGKNFCSRLGAACDFRVDGVKARDVIEWIVRTQLPFDRIYFYGDERALHVSWGPNHSRYICGFNQQNLPSLKPVLELHKLAQEVYR